MYPVTNKTSPEIEVKIIEKGNQMGPYYRGLYQKIAIEFGVSVKVVRRLLNPVARNRYYEWQKIKRSTTARVEIDGIKRRIKVDRKSPKPGRCELCHKEAQKQGMNWHHWDDEHPEIGLWLCLNCHGFAEGADSGLKVEEYSSLKDKANRGEL